MDDEGFATNTDGVRAAPNDPGRDYRQMRGSALAALVDNRDPRTGGVYATLTIASAIRAGCHEIAVALGQLTETIARAANIAQVIER